MKIGILTFHWPENYGAVLQAYALQSYLTDLGHNVHIINYKPINQDLYYLNILLHPDQMKQFGNIRRRKQKKALLDIFRKTKLHLTRRYYSFNQLMNSKDTYDLLISGSDQVLNPSFTMNGERKPTPTYYLPFYQCKKIGYALSFGCTQYPPEAKLYAEKWIQNFDATGVREDSGLNVLQQLNFKKPQIVVPDPTILYSNHLFDKIDIKKNTKQMLCVYILRHTIKLDEKDVFYMDDEHTPVDMETWLGLIISSCGLVTNSYHGMIMAILSHIPFVALLETKSGVGMNDRFNTLLTRLNLLNRILPIDADSAQVLQLLDDPIDWYAVDKAREDYSKVGMTYLSNYLCE